MQKEKIERRVMSILAPVIIVAICIVAMLLLCGSGQAVTNFTNDSEVSSTYV